MDHLSDPFSAQEEHMPRVPPPENNEPKKRYVCSLPTSALQTWSDYSLMLEELAAAIALANGNELPRRRKQKNSGPAHSTMDHVLFKYITKVLATDPDFIKWQREKHAADSAQSGSTISTTSAS
jgi:hypothetical protein